MKRKRMDSPFDHNPNNSTSSDSSSSDDDIDNTPTIDELDDEPNGEPVRVVNPLGWSISELQRPTVYIDSDGEEYSGDQVDALQSSVSNLTSPANNEEDEDEASEEFVHEFQVDMFDPFQPFVNMINSTMSILQTMIPNAGSNAAPVQPFNFVASTGSINFMSAFSTLYTHPAPNQGSTGPTGLPIASVMSMDLPLRNPRSQTATWSELFQSDISSPSNISIRPIRLPVFTEEERVAARDHLFALCFDVHISDDTDTEWNGEDFEEPSNQLLYLVLTLWERSGRTRFPALNEMVSEIVQDYTDDLFRSELNMDDLYNIIEHWIVHFSYIPAYHECIYIHEFFTLNHFFPDRQELQSFITRTIQFYLNPEAFHQQDKELVPTLFAERIPQYTNADETCICSICQDEIKLGTKCMQLPQCKHTFHAESTDCLEEGSIYTWLSRSNKCPLCKTKVDTSNLSPSAH